jgi:hypothetical protein
MRRRSLDFSIYIKEGRLSGGPSFVAVMPPADPGQRHHLP